MPKIVDHDLQRETFAEAAMRLIARNGLEGVTMRAVATEMLDSDVGPALEASAQSSEEFPSESDVRLPSDEADV